MKSTSTVLVTGANGFLGRNLSSRLRVREDLILREFDIGNSLDELAAWAAEASAIFHLAGVNRAEKTEEFEIGNVGLTENLCRILDGTESGHHVIFASSIQADLPNTYGKTKRLAEAVLEEYFTSNPGQVTVFRLKNVFGKWCRPNYNSVVATFCHNISRHQQVFISDPKRELELVYIDDVIDALIDEMDKGQGPRDGVFVKDSIPQNRISLGDLAERLQLFWKQRVSFVTPDLSNRFDRQLYSTLVSHIEPPDWEYPLDQKSDSRGTLAEFLKSQSVGQIFLSRTKPGVTRGNHFHHSKTEKFLVVEGEGKAGV